MAANFRIDTSKENSKSVIINIIGDFDGTSAWELINKLEECSKKNSLVVVNTKGLKCFEPFGLGVFERNASQLSASPSRFVVTGDNADVLAIYKPFSKRKL